MSHYKDVIDLGGLNLEICGDTEDELLTLTEDHQEDLSLIHI